MKFVLPVSGSIARYPKGKLIQGFGENPSLYTRFAHKGHNGWDLIGTYGEPIYAISDGLAFHVEITKDPKINGYGNNIIIMSDPDENGIHVESTYGHMTPNHKIKQGERVRAGQQIGEMGNSGFIVSGGVPYWQFSNPDNRGTHLHLTTKRYKQVNGQFQLLNSNNGFGGAFNPAELYKETPMAKKVFINDGGKIGVLVLEGFTFGGGFAKDPASLEKLKQAFEFSGNEPTINIP